MNAKIEFYYYFRRYALFLIVFCMIVGMKLKLSTYWFVFYSVSILIVYHRSNAISKERIQEKNFALTSSEHDHVRLVYKLDLFLRLPFKEDMALIPGNADKSDYELLKQALEILKEQRGRGGPAA